MISNLVGVVVLVVLIIWLMRLGKKPTGRYRKKTKKEKELEKKIELENMKNKPPE